MKRKAGFIFLVMALLLIPVVTQAFNPGAHIYIADKVFPKCLFKADLYYGSIAPDLSSYVSDLSKWPAGFEDTHYTYDDLRPYAMLPTQRAFALGWLTHNELCGADYYAHISYYPGSSTGYVIERGAYLSAQTGLTPELSHMAIELAIDLLLKRNVDPKIGERILAADLLRSFTDRQLLAKVLVCKEKRTDNATLCSAEDTFRDIVRRYGMALSLPEPLDKTALAKLSVQIALEQYGVVLTPEEVAAVIDIAMQDCADCREVLDAAAEEMAATCK